MMAYSGSALFYEITDYVNNEGRVIIMVKFLRNTHYSVAQ